jgi:hypothetical protein
MLRGTQRDAESPGTGASIEGQPRTVVPAPVFEPPSDGPIVLRGRVRSGGAAAVILEPDAVCVVTADRASRCRLRRFTIQEVLAVEEHRGARGTELVIVAATTAISILDVDVAQAWSFCREVRQLIQEEAGTARVSRG